MSNIRLLAELTLGIDLSVDPKRTVACRIEWTERQAQVAAPTRPIKDDRLIELLSGDGPCGVDVPLGWPTQFVEAVTAHRAFLPWPDSAGDALAFRATDRWVAGKVGWKPLSVSTDKLGRTALRVAKAMAQVSGGWPATYRAGVVGGVVEVYPAAALSRWATRRYRYKSGPRAKAELAALARELFARPWLTFESEDCRQMYAKDEDNLDALIASLVARAHSKDLCEPTPTEYQREAEVEGWIALPMMGSLDLLPISKTWATRERGRSERLASCG